MTFNIEEDKNFSYITRGEKHVFKYESKEVVVNNSLDLLNKSINQVFNYLNYKNIEIKPFKLIINSELEENENNKYGFGSSSALVTGTIKSILMYHNLNPSDLLVYKLSVITTYKANKLSSGGDIASALLGGIIYYRRYNLKWLLKNIDKENIYDIKWKSLKIKKIKTNMNFAAIWTKKSYSFKELSYIFKNKDYKNANKIVKKTYNNLINNNYLKLKDNINDYQNFLEKILKEDKLYTKELELCVNIAKNYNLASKISGAGGGDSVILLYPKYYNFDNLEKELNINNLELIKFKRKQNEY